MQVLETKTAVREVLQAARAEGRRIGLVPTMGYLHAGHVSLVERSVADNDLTLVTIFVNPLQFAPGEDLATYPRDLDGDLAKAAGAGADVVFAPSTEEMYPEPMRTTVSVSVAEGFMESATRPTHFDGVATVVTKLFAVVGPCRAYFGEKDYQQLAVVRRLVTDLELPVELVACPIVREADGLAMSSRNAYLSADERAVAPRLYEALQLAVESVRSGERSAAVLRALMTAHIAAEATFELDYAEVVDPVTLEPVDNVETVARALVAARLGTPRLLDNVELHT